MTGGFDEASVPDSPNHHRQSGVSDSVSIRFRVSVKAATNLFNLWLKCGRKLTVLRLFRRYEEDMYWRRMEEEQHHWDERRRLPDGGYPQGPPGLLGVRPGMPGLQPQGPVVGLIRLYSAPVGY